MLLHRLFAHFSGGRAVGAHRIPLGVRLCGDANRSRTRYDHCEGQREHRGYPFHGISFLSVDYTSAEPLASILIRFLLSSEARDTEIPIERSAQAEYQF